MMFGGRVETSKRAKAKDGGIMIHAVVVVEEFLIFDFFFLSSLFGSGCKRETRVNAGSIILRLGLA
jgi:hypothetical protein